MTTTVQVIIGNRSALVIDYPSAKLAAEGAERLNKASGVRATVTGTTRTVRAIYDHERGEY